MSTGESPRAHSLRWVRTATGIAGIALLALFAVILAAHFTRERIERNEHAWFIAQLDSVLAGQPHDNTPWTDRSELAAPELDTAPVPVYRARLQGRIVAVALTTVAPDGYRGPITLLIGISRADQVLGVSVLAHQETPGLGDAFAVAGSTWLDQFLGRSLESTPPSGWTIKKDGGDFDQFTSASITPRAIVKGVQRALKYAQDHQNFLFGSPQGSPS